VRHQRDLRLVIPCQDSGPRNARLNQPLPYRSRPLRSDERGAASGLGPIDIAGNSNKAVWVASSPALSQIPCSTYKVSQYDFTTL